MEKQLATRQRAIGERCMRAVWLATQKFCLVAACLCVRIEEHVTRGDAALWGYSVCSRMSWDLSVYVRPRQPVNHPQPKY